VELQGLLRRPASGVGNVCDDTAGEFHELRGHANDEYQARQGLQPRDAAQLALKDSSRGSVKLVRTEASKSGDASQNVRKIRVRVDSGNRAWQEGLIRMLANHSGLEMLGLAKV
jgi:hypothetical protein